MRVVKYLSSGKRVEKVRRFHVLIFADLGLYLLLGREVESIGACAFAGLLLITVYVVSTYSQNLATFPHDIVAEFKPQ
jgi:hypothetical protein